MTQYELDIAADQIVRWLRDEIAAGRRNVAMRATREYVAEPVERREEAGLSEDTDVAALTTIGLLEAWPTGADNGWRLRIRVEDIVGPHTPEEEPVPPAAEEIDLDDFIGEFITPDRGAIFVSVDCDSLRAKRRFDRLFTDLVRDRHRR